MLGGVVLEGGRLRGEGVRWCITSATSSRKAAETW